MFEFNYGLKARPPAIGAVPKGFCNWIQKVDVSEAIKSEWDEVNFRHGILSYATELTASQISSYELIDMNVRPIETLWLAFVELCEDMNEYEIDFKEFCAFYVHPHGELRTANPLHRMKPKEFFSLLEEKGFTGSLEGLEKFYNQI